MMARLDSSLRERWVDIPWYALLALAFLLPISPALSNVAIVLGLMGWVARGIVQRRPTLRSITMDRLFLLFGVAAALSLVNSVTWTASARGLLKIVKAFGVFLLASEEIRTERQVRQWVIACLCGVIVASGDGLLQWVIGVDPIYRAPLGSPLEGLRRVSGPYHHSNAFGLFLTFMVPLSLAMVHRGGSWRLRGLGWMAFPLAMTALVMTFSRGALLGCAVALLGLIVIWRAWGWLIGCLVAGLLVLAWLPAPIKTWVSAQPNLWAMLVQSEDPHTSRPQQWRTAQNMIADHPWVGVGVNTFVLNYDRYRGPDEGETNRPYAHNQYLQMLAEIGVVGFAVFLLMIATVLRRVVRVVRGLQDPLRSVALAIGFGLLAFLINGFDESALYYSRLAPIFWLGCGMLFAAPFTASGSHES